MATTSNTSVAASIEELRLLSDFMNTVTARQQNKGVTVEELTLSYTLAKGFTITLKETPNNVPAAEAGTSA